jgi:hypothetical protein
MYMMYYRHQASFSLHWQFAFAVGIQEFPDGVKPDGNMQRHCVYMWMLILAIQYN